MMIKYARNFELEVTPTHSGITAHIFHSGVFFVFYSLLKGGASKTKREWVNDS